MVRYLNRFNRLAPTTLALGWLFTLPLSAQVPVAPMEIPRAQFFNATGQPLAGGCINFFAAGTSTPQAIYADNGGVNQLANPLTLDSAGEASVWLSNTAYRIVANTGVVGQPCSSALGTQLWVEDNKNIYAILTQSQNLFLNCATSDPTGVNGEMACRSDLGKMRFFFNTWDSIVQEALAATLTNKTFDISANTLKNSTNTAGHYPRSNGMQYVDSVMPASDAVKSYTNEGVTGTTLNLIVKLAGAPSTAVRASNLDTSGAIGICIAGCGIGGTGQIATLGLISCAFDGATTAGDYVQMSTITGGQCHDTGIAPPSFPSNGNGVQGRVLSTNIGSGTYTMDWSPEVKAPFTSVLVTAINTTGLAANVSSTPILTPLANGFYRASCYLVVTQAATTSSTLPNCQIAWTDADSGAAFETSNLTATVTTNLLGTISIAGPGTNVIYAKSGASISYLTSGYASVGGTPMQYAIHLRLEGPF